MSLTLHWVKMNLTAIISLTFAILFDGVSILLLAAIFGVLIRVEKELKEARKAIAAVVYGEQQIIEAIDQRLIKILQQYFKETNVQKH